MSGHTLFISDLHLQENEPQITANFEHFILHEAMHADALYILGDFFEAWIGDDDRTAFHTKISEILRGLAAKNVPIYFMHGNRDFLLGKRFATQCRMSILPDPSLIDLYGHRVLLSHGDMLCTLDIRHQKYRRVALNPRWQNLFLKVPLWIRRKIPKYMRKQSQRYTQSIADYIIDVTEEAVEKLMTEFQVPRLIHGHTHRPKVHNLTINNSTAERIVLGAWHEKISYLRFFADGNYEMKVTELS